MRPAWSWRRTASASGGTGPLRLISTKRQSNCIWKCRSSFVSGSDVVKMTGASMPRLIPYVCWRISS